MKNRTWFAVSLALLVLSFGFIVGWFAMGYRLKHAEQGEPLIIADGGAPEGGLLYVSYAKTFFLSQGYHVTLLPFSSGRDSLGALMEGKADLATVGDTPIVRAALTKHPLKVLATIGTSGRHVGLVAKRSKVSSPSQLPGKKIGVTPRTSGTFFLHTLLVKHQIPESSVIVVPIEPAEMVAALVQEKVDAVVTWSPYLPDVIDAAGEETTTMFLEDVYQFTWNLVATQDFIRDQKRTIAIIRALRMAEERVRGTPKDAMRLISRYVRLNHDWLESVWEGMSLDATLAQSLISTFERQAKWLIDSEEFSSAQMPNFMEIIHPDALVEVSPEKVSLIR